MSGKEIRTVKRTEIVRTETKEETTPTGSKVMKFIYYDKNGNIVRLERPKLNNFRR